MSDSEQFLSPLSFSLELKEYMDNPFENSLFPSFSNSAFEQNDDYDSCNEKNDKNHIKKRSFYGTSTNFMSEKLKKVPFSEKQYETAKYKQENKNNNFIGKKRIIFKTDKLRDSKLYNTGKFDDYSEEKFNEAFEALNSKNFKEFKKTRKYHQDDIRTKYMSKFFKSLIKRLNKKLKLVKSKNLFCLLPAIFIKNFTSKILKAKRAKNIAEMDLTFENIILTNFCGTEENSELYNNKYNRNLSVLDYLESTPEINKFLNYNIIKNMKFSQLFRDYLYSKEFKIDIYCLKFKKKKEKKKGKHKEKNKGETEEKTEDKEENKENIEDDEYIKNYIKKAFNFINSFAQ